MSEVVVDRSQFLAWIAETVALPADEVTETSSLTEIGWDSLSSINLSVLAEDRWGILVGEADLADVTTVGDLIGKFADNLKG